MTLKDVIEWERGLAQTRHEDRLNLIENEAQRCIAIQEMHGVQFPSEQMAGDLARAVLAMLPVVRLVEKYIAADLVSLDLPEAFNEMRRAMEGK